MFKENVQHIMTLLQSGVFPLYKLRVRKGRDSRLIRVMDSDSTRFYCIFADNSKVEKLIIAHDSIKHGTFILEQIEETTAA